MMTNALDHAAGARVRLSGRSEGREAVIDVEDSGNGIADEHLPHVFDRFWRADRARARTLGGSGLGLAITRESVRAHAGEVTVSSEPNAGTRFTIRLPARPRLADEAPCRAGGRSTY